MAVTQDARTFKIEDTDKVQIALLKAQREQANKGRAAEQTQYTGSLMARDVDDAQIALLKVQNAKAATSRMKLTLPKVFDK